MRIRNGLPMVLFIVLLVAIPITEIYLLIAAGERIGWLPTLLVVLLEAVVGAILMRREGARAWKALADASLRGKMPTGELADAALVLVGGALLLLPGFLTDLLGFLLLIPMTRPLAKKVIAFFVARRLNKLGVPAARARMDQGNLIEGETLGGPPTNQNGTRGDEADQTIIVGEIEDPGHRPGR